MLVPDCCWAYSFFSVLHGESNTGQASPRTPTQRTIQPQEAAQPQRNQTILQPDTPAQQANYSYKWSHPILLRVTHAYGACVTRGTCPCGYGYIIILGLVIYIYYIHTYIHTCLAGCKLWHVHMLLHADAHAAAHAVGHSGYACTSSQPRSGRRTEWHTRHAGGCSYAIYH